MPWEQQSLKPADISLNVDDSSEGHNESNGEGEVPPIEEAFQLCSALLCFGVKLISSKGYVAGPDAACT